MKKQKNKTFAEAANEWIKNNRLKLKGGTINKYQNILSTHIIPQIGKYKLSQFSSEFINSYLFEKIKNGKINGEGGLSPSYVNSIRIVIKSIINFAVEEELMPPLKSKIEKPTIYKESPEILTTKEQECLEQELIKETNYTKIGIMLSLYTGLRIGEVCALKWEDIDLAMGVIYIRHTISRVINEHPNSKTKTELILDSPKTYSSKRSIPIPTVLFSYIKNLESSQKTNYIVSNSETFLSPRTYEYRYHKILKKCGINDINYHALRHPYVKPTTKKLLIFRNFLFGSVIAFFLHSLLRRKTLAAFLFRPATGTRNACPRSYNKNRFSYISPFPLCRYKNVLCNVLYFNPLTGKNKHLINQHINQRLCQTVCIADLTNDFLLF